MLKVLLVDDEPIIREGLKSIIDWGAHGYTICGEAANGIEGIERICRLEPDLAIVDIKMPGMNGLKMISELKNMGIQCEYIILSAYSEYARSAAEMGIGPCILKPIEQSELIERIDEIRETLLKKNRKDTRTDRNASCD